MESNNDTLNLKPEIPKSRDPLFVQKQEGTNLVQLSLSVKFPALCGGCGGERRRESGSTGTRRRAGSGSTGRRAKRRSGPPSLSYSTQVTTLQRKHHLCISFLGIARPQPQFPHSCVCERFICGNWD